MLLTFLFSRKIASLATLVLVMVGVGAGVWQVKRAQGKIALGNELIQMEALKPVSLLEKDWSLQEINYRRVFVRGYFLPEYAIWLDNRPRPSPEMGGSNLGHSGFYVLMPFQIEGKENKVIWVNRGWVPRDVEDRLRLPKIETPQQTIQIQGLVFSGPGKVFELGSEKSDDEKMTSKKPRVMQNFILEDQIKIGGWNQFPFIVRQSDPNNGDGLSRNWPPITFGVDRHYAYAFQWFSLAACATLFWLITGWLAYRKQTS